MVFFEYILHCYVTYVVIPLHYAEINVRVRFLGQLRVPVRVLLPFQAANIARIATSPRNMDIAAVNDLSYEEFVNIFGNVVEKCPIVAAAVWPERPFLSFTALEAAINDFIDILPHAGRNEWIFFHERSVCVHI